MEDSNRKWRCKIGDRIEGPVEAGALKKIPGFTLQSLVAPEGVEDWRPAFQVIDLSSHFGQPVHPKSSQGMDAGLEHALGMLADEPPSAELAPTEAPPNLLEADPAPLPDTNSPSSQEDFKKPPSREILWLVGAAGVLAAIALAVVILLRSHLAPTIPAPAPPPAILDVPKPPAPAVKKPAAKKPAVRPPAKSRLTKNKRSTKKSTRKKTHKTQTTARPS